jgi:hypothetical protein
MPVRCSATLASTTWALGRRHRGARAAHHIDDAGYRNGDREAPGPTDGQPCGPVNRPRLVELSLRVVLPRNPHHDGAHARAGNDASDDGPPPRAGSRGAGDARGHWSRGVERESLRGDQPCWLTLQLSCGAWAGGVMRNGRDGGHAHNPTTSTLLPRQLQRNVRWRLTRSQCARGA